MTKTARRPFFGAAQGLFRLLLFSLAFMRPSVSLFGMAVVPTDLIFLLLFAIWAVALLRGEAKLEWQPGFAFIIIYFLGLAASVPLSDAPVRSGYKLLTQIYLLTLPALAYSLVESREDLRRTFDWWLAGTSVVAALALVSIATYLVDPGNSWLAVMINEFGTLPEGRYPRLRLTYEVGNFLCTYLTVSLMMLIGAHRVGWASTRNAVLLGGGIVLAAITTISPSLGGFILGIAIWLWLMLKVSRQGLARVALAGGITAALAFMVASSVTPILHPTAPFLIHLPYTEFVLAPSVRLLTWLDAVRSFLAHPLLGKGLGLEAVGVPYQGPGGKMHFLTDAHNSFLNIAAQCGLVGLAAFLLLLAFIARRTLPLRLLPDKTNAIRMALGLALLNVLAWQGLIGSYEDGRFIWVALGLFLISGRLESDSRANCPPSNAARRGHS